LAGVDDGLQYAADYLADVGEGSGWDRDAVLRQAQIDDVYVAAFATPAELKAMSVPVDLAMLAELARRAESLRFVTDPVAAFSKFADIEDSFEEVEAGVHSAVRGIDDAVDLEIQRRRGN
jgi:hypothetical protein